MFNRLRMDISGAKYWLLGIYMWMRHWFCDDNTLNVWVCVYIHVYTHTHTHTHTQASLHPTTHIRMGSSGTSQQWSLACKTSSERDTWISTSSNNCSCQDSKFSQCLQKNESKTQKPNRCLKSWWKSACFLLSLMFPCAIPHPRSPGMTLAPMELSGHPNSIHQGS